MSQKGGGRSWRSDECETWDLVELTNWLLCCLEETATFHWSANELVPLPDKTLKIFEYISRQPLFVWLEKGPEILLFCRSLMSPSISRHEYVKKFLLLRWVHYFYSGKHFLVWSSIETRHPTVSTAPGLAASFPAPGLCAVHTVHLDCPRNQFPRSFPGGLRWPPPDYLSFAQYARVCCIRKYKLLLKCSGLIQRTF